jgi:L-asparagine transporter-like permease
VSKLKNRHLQMIAIGGAIGTGLFFGLAKSILQTGPSIILSYLLGGFLVYIIMRALGEMVVYEPNSGAFTFYANKYINNYLGFISGWYSWFEYTIVCMLEISAVTIFTDLWFPTIPHWFLIAIILIVFFIINIVNINLFGEFEFWLSSIKVITIILMILFSGYLIITNKVNNSYNFYNNFYSHNFFANGVSGFLFSFVLVVFSFGGTQFIGIAAADTEHPSITVPKAINGVITRIALFYIATIIAILFLYPWQKLSGNISPFVEVFEKIGIYRASFCMNLVAITAALSAFNSCLFASSRVLHSLAKQKNAPKIFAKKNKKHIPNNALTFTSLIIALTVLINYLFPDKAIFYLISIATTSIIFTWSTILICHIYFRIKISNTSYKLFLYPWTNYIALSLLIMVIITMLYMPDMRNTLFIMPVWLIILTTCYIIKTKKTKGN